MRAPLSDSVIRGFRHKWIIFRVPRSFQVVAYKEAEQLSQLKLGFLIRTLTSVVHRRTMRVNYGMELLFLGTLLVTTCYTTVHMFCLARLHSLMKLRKIR